MTLLRLIYIVGVVWALVRTDARPLARIAPALLWPLGPLAFAVTLAILLAASLIAFPRFGAGVLAVAALAWWALS